jgi:hypothetical protein
MKGKSIFSGHYSKEDREWVMVEESCEATTGTSTFIVMGLKYQVKARGNYCIGIYSEDGQAQGTFYLVLAGVLICFLILFLATEYASFRPSL